MTKHTDADLQRINRVAAMMAISNMGQTVDVPRVLEWKPDSRYPRTARHEIEDLAGHFMETTEHEDIFALEAEDWVKTILSAGGLVPFAEQYPHHAETIVKIMEL